MDGTATQEEETESTKDHGFDRPAVPGVALMHGGPMTRSRTKK